MITLLYVLYVMVCLFLILVVLLQAGRGGMGAAFGGGSSQTVFGSSGAGNFLTRLTVVSAALFMMLSAALTYVSSSGEKSLESASERVRAREEAASGKSKDGKAEAKPAEEGKPAAQSSSEASGTPTAEEPAPTEAAEPKPAEGAPTQQ